MYRNCSGEISLHKPFVWPSENVSPIWIRQNKFLKCWWDGQGKKKKTWFFSVKLGKTAQPSSKSAGLSWLSRLRRGLCHCLLACLRSSISSKIFEGWLVSKHKKLYAASCGANCKNYKSKETPVLVCHCKNEWSSTSQKWAMYTT